MTALKEMTVYKHNACDNPVAYQNIPVLQSGVDRSDGRQWEPFSYTRTDIHQAALDRIVELEGALGDMVNKMDNRLIGMDKALSNARAVLAKGDG